MRHFVNRLKKGSFVISYCVVCKRKIWPPYEHCPLCYRKALPISAGKLGRIVEFSKSGLEADKVFVALIDLDGILLLGSVSDGHGITVGAKVELISSGVSPEGKIDFCFRILDRFSSYTVRK